MYFYTSLINLLHYFKIYCPINIKITCQDIFQVVLVVKNQAANSGDIWDAGSIPGSGRSPGGGHGNPLQYSCLGNPMDSREWWATVHGVPKCWTQRKQISTHVHNKAMISCFAPVFERSNWSVFLRQIPTFENELTKTHENRPINVVCTFKKKITTSQLLMMMCS